ncbi:MAG: DUF262 domain-containing protein [Bacteroidetes bacterium]|nr:MAG: DUF262 domain-containing protein [Bacteroidota bacterium]
MKETNHLFEGEEFALNTPKGSNIIQISDEDINQKYRRGEIRIVTEQARYPLDSIETMLDTGKYILNPEYQRRKRWDNVRKSRLIESFIMNVPIPPVFLYEVDYSKYEVMDGQQRLTTIYDFYQGKFELEGLELWSELNGKTYQNLPEQVKGGIDRRYLSSIVLLRETAKNDIEAEELKKMVFERLNSGGEKLTPQETRNAIYNGKFNQLCLRLAKSDAFRKMWGLPLESDSEIKKLKSEPYRKMEDAELVLRFFAYRHVNELVSPIDKFLDAFLDRANSFSDKLMQELEDIFIKTIDLIYAIFGKDAFLLPIKVLKYKTPSKTVYDPMMQAFSTNLQHKDILLAKCDEVRRKRYEDTDVLFISDSKYLFDGRKNNRNDVIERIEYFDKFIKSFIETT